MSDTVITAEGLGKSYIIGHQQQEPYVALRDVISKSAKHWWSRLRNPHHHTHANKEEFWALKDVSFKIKQGDRVGIIGRNGAGKSTLLKVLSRITEPTTGRVRIKGRVASLLEVGTGFHPELTGRENIFLNGAILGMNRAEVKKKFDEIVNFAEVEKFLDTPVKRYSSGMYVRLAFAVAAHLEPEILVVDEVLAVGDAQFQKKCLGKMDAVGKKGRTVLFVSHNMGAIQQLCSTSILLRDGAAQESGPTKKVIESYIKNFSSTAKESIAVMPRAREDYGTVARFMNAWPVNSKGERTVSFMSGEDLSFALEIKIFEKVDALSIVVGLDTYMDYRITTVLSEEEDVLFSGDQDALITLNLKFPHLRLKPGTYSLTLGIRRHKVPLDHLVKAINFEVSEISVNHSKNHDPLAMRDILIESVWSLS